MKYYNFHGHSALPLYEDNAKINDPKLYVPSIELENAVNVAIYLGRPLLLTGEPGTGKTQLAFSIASAFNLGKPLVFNARTTSTAKDLFYHYDAIAHFQYSQHKDNAMLSPEEVEKRFIRYEALGLAIRENRRAVVLIDEIDKAPRDFPNDILNVIEELYFEVPEVGKVYRADSPTRPIIIFTSNSEKNLPDAFLRRCIFYHIPFPNEKELISILAKKIDTGFYSQTEIAEVLVPYFMKLREEIAAKKPGTAELLYWILILKNLKVHTSVIKKANENVASLTADEREKLNTSYSVLSKTDEDNKRIQALLG